MDDLAPGPTRTAGFAPAGLEAVALYGLLAGAMDTTTGLLLVIEPALVLRLLGLEPASPIFLRWLGVFVAQVGLAYLYPWWRHLLPTAAPRPSSAVLWPVIFELTAMARLAVATFLTWALVSGALPTPWLTVLLSDATLAAVQLIWLRRSTFEDPRT
jgi:hypothetical protein